MSTRCTIRHGDRWHLYEECLDDSSVYLELENVEVSLNTCGNNNDIIVKLDVDLALEIGLISDKEKPTKIDWDNFGNNLKKFVRPKNNTEN